MDRVAERKFKVGSMVDVERLLILNELAKGGNLLMNISTKEGSNGDFHHVAQIIKHSPLILL